MKLVVYPSRRHTFFVTCDVIREYELSVSETGRTLPSELRIVMVNFIMMAVSPQVICVVDEDTYRTDLDLYTTNQRTQVGAPSRSPTQAGWSPAYAGRAQT